MAWTRQSARMLFSVPKSIFVPPVRTLAGSVLEPAELLKLQLLLGPSLRLEMLPLPRCDN